jgi:hypothetical protein
MGYFAPVVGCDRSDCSIFGSCFFMHLDVNSNNKLVVLSRKPTPHSDFLEKTLNTAPKTARKQHTSP